MSDSFWLMGLTDSGAKDICIVGLLLSKWFRGEFDGLISKLVRVSCRSVRIDCCEL